MTIHADTFDYWKTNGTRHVIPVGPEFPEGWDPRPFLVLLSAGQQTVEFGCGYGRLAGMFDPALYEGIDINPAAIPAAKGRHPDHKFTLLDFNDPMPDAPFYFAYTVFLHIDDETLPKILASLPKSCKRFCIAEIMGREWRLEHQKDPPVFAREPGEYIDMMAKEGFQCTGKFSFPYVHYIQQFLLDNQMWRTYMRIGPEVKVNVNIDFLLFYRD